jgi:hypothetical protein
MNEIVKHKMEQEKTSLEKELNEKNRVIETMSERWSNQEQNYRRQMEHLTEKISWLQKANDVEIDNKWLKEKEKYIQELENEKNKYILLLNEKQTKVEKITEKYEEILLCSNKSTVHKGAEGEKKFETFADTFKDFKGFELKDKHTQSGSGDFHLQFEEFSVLVDAKNYKKKVPIEQREKIKNDLLKNDHIHFGWLVSLNTSIDKFDRAPVMYEWINTKQCLVHINQLLSFEDPSKILRIVWFTCKELYKLIEDVNVDEEEIVKIKEQRFVFLDKIKALRKSIREINTAFNSTKNMIQLMDDQLKEILGAETTEIVDSGFALFADWWCENVEQVEEEVETNSTELWYHFRQKNKDVLKEFDITTEKFKQYINTKVPLHNIVKKNKNPNSAFIIKGIRLLSQQPNEI